MLLDKGVYAEPFTFVFVRPPNCSIRPPNLHKSAPGGSDYIFHRSGTWCPYIWSQLSYRLGHAAKSYGLSSKCILGVANFPSVLAARPVKYSSGIVAGINNSEKPFGPGFSLLIPSPGARYSVRHSLHLCALRCRCAGQRGCCI